MVAACLGIIDQLGLPGGARLSLSQEEKLMGSFGAIGKRLLLAQDFTSGALPAGDTTITLEWDFAAGDVPFPLVGTINIIDGQTGVDSTALAQPVQVNTINNVAFTRARGSNVLNLGVINALGVGINATTGQIVQLAPGQSGPIFKPYASAIEAKDMVQLMFLTEIAVVAHVNPTP